MTKADMMNEITKLRIENKRLRGLPKKLRELLCKYLDMPKTNRDIIINAIEISLEKELTRLEMK